MNTQEELIEVYRARNSMQAHLFASTLEDEGIKAVVDGDSLQSGLGQSALGWSAAPRILVVPSDEGRARGILERLDQGKSAEDGQQ